MARDDQRRAGSHRSRRFEDRLEQTWKFLKSEQTVLVIIYAFALFLLAGGIFDVVESTQPVIGTGTSILFICPFGLSCQTTYESIGAAAFFSITTLGFFLMYQSTRRVHEPRYATQLLGFGGFLFIIGIISIYVILLAKGAGI